MKRRGDSPAKEAPPVGETVGTMIAFGAGGVQLWSADGFRAGHDTVPRGVSMAMVASVLLDPATGEVLRQWNPWGAIG